MNRIKDCRPRASKKLGNLLTVTLAPKTMAATTSCCTSIAACSRSAATVACWAWQRKDCRAWSIEDNGLKLQLVTRDLKVSRASNFTISHLAELMETFRNQMLASLSAVKCFQAMLSASLLRRWHLCLHPSLEGSISNSKKTLDYVSVYIIQYGSGLKQRPTAVVLEVLSFDPEYFFLPMNIKTQTPMTERKDCFSGKHAQISWNMA